MPWVPFGPLKGPSQTWMPAGPAEKAGGRGEQLAGLALGEHESGPDVAGQRRDGDDPVLESQPVRRRSAQRYDVQWHRDLRWLRGRTFVADALPVLGRPAKYRLYPHPTFTRPTG